MLITNQQSLHSSLLKESPEIASTNPLVLWRLQNMFDTTLWSQEGRLVPPCRRVWQMGWGP